MRILVDADACPVIPIVEQIAAKYGVPIILLCDTNHELSSNYSKVLVVSAGSDAVDFTLINLAKKGDIVVSQDYGVAALALAKGCYAIHQSGKWYTNDSIDGLLMDRHVSKKARNTKNKYHLKGQPKRTKEDNIRFEESFERLVRKALNL